MWGILELTVAVVCECDLYTIWGDPDSLLKKVRISKCKYKMFGNKIQNLNNPQKCNCWRQQLHAFTELTFDIWSKLQYSLYSFELEKWCKILVMSKPFESTLYYYSCSFQTSWTNLKLKVGFEKSCKCAFSQVLIHKY